MLRFLKVLIGAWITGCVLGGGCFCGALATGMLVPRPGPSDEYALVQAQIVEIQATLNRLDYDAAVRLAEGVGE